MVTTIRKRDLLLTELPSGRIEMLNKKSAFNLAMSLLNAVQDMEMRDDSKLNRPRAKETTNHAS